MAINVAPHAGAWIETLYVRVRARSEAVAPHAGAWIETRYRSNKSLVVKVAPHAGAWIETMRSVSQSQRSRGRAPRGRVD